MVNAWVDRAPRPGANHGLVAPTATDYKDNYADRVVRDYLFRFQDYGKGGALLKTAKAEVFALMDELARAGKVIVMVSSELPELLQVADRILVMRDGEIVTELPRQTTQQEIMRYAAVGK